MSPLGGGKLTRPWGTSTKRATTDRYNKSMYDQSGDAAIVSAVETAAKARRVSMAQVAMAWLLREPGITSPIVGVSKMDHLEDAISAVDFTLSDTEVQLLESPYQPLLVSGFWGFVR